ncbi:MAG: OmpA family protein [Beggiatoa sp.]|nr:OmpA family protein [Beggiatoa sp.]
MLFDFDQVELRPDALDALRKVATVIASTPGPVVIEGHTDSKGEDAYNQTLSERRASPVKTWLAREGGINAARISTHGLGETQPKVPNATPDGSDDPAGRQQNRRVEITIKKRG